VLIGWQGRILVGAGSTIPIARSRPTASPCQSRCAEKVVAPVLWELEEVTGHWDRMILRSHAWIDGARVLYQEGTLDACCRSTTYPARLWGGGTADACAMFGGTFAAKGGIRPASRFRIRARRPRAEAQHSSRL